MSDPVLDGTLHAWADIRSRFARSALLLGNGLSINVWPHFDYGSLFEHACRGGLTATDQMLFEDTPNFETVLADLNTAIRVNAALKLDAAPIYERYRSIQQALGQAIREVHVGAGHIALRKLDAIRDVLTRYEWIFTTSYDLILYWAMGCRGKWQPFVDGFYVKQDDRLVFDSAHDVVRDDQIPVYFLHGALHLVVGGSGMTWKLRGKRDLQTILDQFGDPIAGDPQARPLLVTEGSAQDKLRAIEGNVYLARALEHLRENELPLVVFGSRLGDSDEHLIDALNEHPLRAVAVSMVPASKRELARAQSEIYGRLNSETLLFFDATTHPLGDVRLRAES
ncbi:MAG TPA: DUF4917 family protein [Solirubrobacteraceae bacterium]|nr:DUF4917 family protein [Solirubrobacteraceae bacterium]